MGIGPIYWSVDIRMEMGTYPYLETSIQNNGMGPNFVN